MSPRDVASTADQRTGSTRHELACGAVVTLTLAGDVSRCRHQGFRCPDVERLAHACAGELAEVLTRQTSATFLFTPRDPRLTKRKPDRRQLELAFRATRSGLKQGRKT